MIHREIFKIMEALAITRNAKISAFKCREVTRVLQGLPYEGALRIATLANKKAAGLILKTLLSARANAEQHGLDAAVTYVKLAVVGEGPTLKRFMPRARGSAGRILKRTSHIKIVLSDEKA
jgi:large subunit ribosomal protein L22